MKRISIELAAVAAISLWMPETGNAGDLAVPQAMTPIRPQLTQQMDCPNCARLPQAECIPCNMKFGWTKEQSVKWCARKAHCRNTKG